MKTIEIQKLLNYRGYGPLKEDGIIGINTLSAIKKFQKDNNLEVDGHAGPKTLAVLQPEIQSPISLKRKSVLSEKEVVKKYGQPGPSNLVIMDLPYTMTIAWDKSKITKKIQVHKLVAPKLKAALQEVLDTYGIDKIKQLELDVYGGCYNFRKMTGGSSYSRHSWGIAIDLNPDKNQYAWGYTKAQFAKQEYKQLIQIFYKHGFLNLGVEYNKDWMHFEIAE